MMTTRLRFIGVGVVSIITHVFVALMSAKALSLNPVAVNLCGFSMAMVNYYFGYAYFKFGVNTEKYFNVPLFFAVSLLGLALSSFIIYFSIYGLEWSLAKGIMLVAIVTHMATIFMLKAWGGRLTEITLRKLLVGALISLLPSAVFLKVHLGQVIHHDIAWYLVATRKWLEGQALYDKILEVNPPLNFYYTAPAIWLADNMRVSDADAQYILFSVILWGSLFWCWNILNRENKFSDLRSTLLILGLGLTVTATGLPYAAQREHLLVVLLLPWVVGLLLEPNNECNKRVISRSFLAALGICLKPYFILYPIFITIFLVVSKWSLRPVVSYANITMALTGGSYVVFVALIHPAYFSEIIPLAKSTYDYAKTTEAIITNIELIPLCFFIVLAIGSYTLEQQTTSIFVCLVLASLAVYLVQWKGFDYHLLPLYSWIVLFGVWLMVEHYSPIKLKAIALFVVTCLSAWFIKSGLYQVRQTEWLMQQIQALKPFNSLVVYSTYVSIGPIIAMRNDAEWASRYPTFWTIPVIANTHAERSCNSSPKFCLRLKEIAIETRRHIMEDLTQYTPDLVVIDKMPGYITNKDFSLLKFFSRDAEIVQFLDSKYQVTSDSRFYYLVRK
ncbi:GtrA family protein [Shewanella alkalitolerans]|uniref:GtrA family protein n=1 Tax=Shewanella alkalitolerans TaxID=2864209 RepID=UPI001C6610A0|nr:GtrA family protein [Shewanella alkalitolerans]QYJ99007.1 GtrA family protein [Shewanella alkalitolerans]